MYEIFVCTFRYHRITLHSNDVRVCVCVYTVVFLVNEWMLHKLLICEQVCDHVDVSWNKGS